MPKRLLMLPDIRSTHNVGAFFRCADAFGFDRIYLTGITPCPPRPEISKVALGAELSVPFEYWPNPVTLLRRLKAEGFFVVCLEKTEKSVLLENGNIPSAKDIVLVVGSETGGVDKEVLDLADVVVHIAMNGIKESLNVSIAGGIAMHLLRITDNTDLRSI